MTRASKALWTLAALQTVCTIGWCIVIARTPRYQPDVDVTGRPLPDPPPIQLRPTPPTAATIAPIFTLVPDKPAQPWEWRNCKPGDNREVELWINDSIYPTDRSGVAFDVNGVRDRIDIRGPRVGDTFHATARNVASGDHYTALWVGVDGLLHEAWCTA
jgi:hypothetical protein